MSICYRISKDMSVQVYKVDIFDADGHNVRDLRREQKLDNTDNNNTDGWDTSPATTQEVGDLTPVDLPAEGANDSTGRKENVSAAKDKAIENNPIHRLQRGKEKKTGRGFPVLPPGGQACVVSHDSLTELELNNVYQESQSPSSAAVGAASSVQSSEDQNRAASLQGQDYIDEIRNKKGRVNSFHCKLCNCQLNNPKAKETHVGGRCHQKVVERAMERKVIEDYKKRTSDLLRWMNQTLSDVMITNSVDGVVQELAAFYTYVTVEKPTKLNEKENLESVLFTLRRKMRANNQKPYFPKEFVSNRVWEKVEEAERSQVLRLRGGTGRGGGGSDEENKGTGKTQAGQLHNPVEGTTEPPPKIHKTQVEKKFVVTKFFKIGKRNVKAATLEDFKEKAFEQWDVPTKERHSWGFVALGERTDLVNEKNFQSLEESAEINIYPAGLSVSQDLTGYAFLSCLDSSTFIDRTEVIAKVMELFDSGTKFISVTACARSGKTTTARMLEYFLSPELGSQGNQTRNDNFMTSTKFQRFLEHNCDIAKPEYKELVIKHFRKYPVIFLSLRTVYCDSVNSFYSSFAEILRISFAHHSYLLETLPPDAQSVFKFFLYYFPEPIQECHKQQIQVGLKCLAEYLNNFFDEPVYIIVDECDAPFVCRERKDILEEIHRELVKCINLLKDCPFVCGAYLTGIIQVAGSFAPEINNFTKYPFMGSHTFANSFVLSQEQVQAILKENAKISSIGPHYGGFRNGNGENELYNFFSVLWFSSSQILEYCWKGRAGLPSLIKCLADPVVHEAVLALLAGQSVEIPYFEEMNISALKRLYSHVTDSNDLNISLSYLQQQGYLTFCRAFSMHEEIEVKVPNKETRAGLLQYYKYFISEHNLDNAVDKFVGLIKDVEGMTLLELLEVYENVLKRADGLQVCEALCRALLFCPILFTGPNFHVGVSTNPDISVLIGRYLFCFEIKYGRNQTAKHALTVVRSKKYVAKAFKVLKEKGVDTEIVDTVVCIGVYVDDEDLNVSMAAEVGSRIDRDRQERISDDDEDDDDELASESIDEVAGKVLYKKTWNNQTYEFIQWSNKEWLKNRKGQTRKRSNTKKVKEEEKK